jgi:hypothetical protein
MMGRGNIWRQPLKAGADHSDPLKKVKADHSDPRIKVIRIISIRGADHSDPRLRIKTIQTHYISKKNVLREMY